MNPLSFHLAVLRAAVAFGVLPVAATATAVDAPALPGPSAPAMSARASIDLSRYFATREAALAELDALQREVDGWHPDASTTFAAVFDAAESLARRARRVSAYVDILAARDLDDAAATQARNRVDALGDQLARSLDDALRVRPLAAFDTAAAGDARLARYRHLATDAAARAAHALPPDAAKLADAAIEPLLRDAWTIHQRVERLPLQGQADGTADAKAADRATREAAWRRRWQATQARADVDATLLLGIARTRRALAQARGFADAPSAGYVERGLDRVTVERSLADVRAHLALYGRYHALRAQRIRAATGIDDVRPWDLDAGSDTPPHFTLADVRTIAAAALAPLGRDYVRAFSALLSADAHRLDLADVLGRREAGGFSVSAPGTPAGLYVAAFGGTLGDLRVMLHEGGHAIAAQIADDAGTPSLLAHGPNGLVESYALLNEFLLYDHLAQHARTPAERERYLVALVDDMVFQVFGSAEEATLEQTIHDEVAAGRVQSAVDLDRLSTGVRSAFEPWPADVLHASSSWWASKRLYYQDPFYLVNYLYAGVIAINLYAEAKAHPATFATRYHALLARGYDAPAETLLAPMLGDGVTLDALGARAFEVIGAKLDAIDAVRQPLH